MFTTSRRRIEPFGQPVSHIGAACCAASARRANASVSNHQDDFWCRVEDALSSSLLPLGGRQGDISGCRLRDTRTPPAPAG